MKILLTGGAGFIGSNLLKKLLCSNLNEVICIDNFDKFYSPEIKRNNIKEFINNQLFTLIDGDIRDEKIYNKLPTDFDLIIHLAARAGVRNSIVEPSEYADVNVNGTIRLLEFAKNNSINKFIFASSSSVYGINKHQPWKENDELLPISPYAASKCAAEKYGFTYANLYDISFISLRFFTVYGRRQRPDLAINKFFHAIEREKSIDMYGDGSTYRDYTHVNDVVDGILNTMKSELRKFEVLNISSGKPIKLLKLLSDIEVIVGKKAKINRMPAQAGDVDSTYGDITKAKELINYDPKISIEDGLRDYYNYLKFNE